MTQLDQRLLDQLLRTVGDLPTDQAVTKLLASGLIDRRACEERALYHEIRRIEARGIPRCEAFILAAGAFCCSYEKARNAFYRALRNV